MGKLCFDILTPPHKSNYKGKNSSKCHYVAKSGKEAILVKDYTVFYFLSFPAQITPETCGKIITSIAHCEGKTSFPGPRVYS